MFVLCTACPLGQVFSFYFILTLFHLCCLALAISDWTLGDLKRSLKRSMIKLGRGTACHAFVQNLVPQALEKDCKWPTCLVGEVSIFWTWTVPGHPIHSHPDHMVLWTPYTETTGVFWCLCWVTSCTRTELCLIIPCLFDTGVTESQRSQRLY